MSDRLNWQWKQFQVEVPADHDLLTWLVPYAANMQRRFAVGRDGKTANERNVGSRAVLPLAQFGERVWWMLFLQQPSSGPYGFTISTRKVFGYTDNCPGCANARAGRKQAVDQSEQCHSRMETILSMTTEGHERLERARDRFAQAVKELEDEEPQRKRHRPEGEGRQPLAPSRSNYQEGSSSSSGSALPPAPPPLEPPPLVWNRRPK